MKKVDILVTDMNTVGLKQTKVFTLGLKKERAVLLIGDLETAKLLSLTNGPIYGKDDKKYFPTDGIKFLETLRWAFSGTVVRATEVYDE